MDKQILRHETKNERKQILQDTCIKIDEFTYSRQFSAEELAVKKDELTQHDIVLDKLESEKKDVTAVLNEKLKKVKQERAIMLNHVRTGAEEVTEKVFLLDAQEEGKMGYYNEDGVLVYDRSLLSDEKQMRLQIKTGISD